jgi:hypothetical protein
MEAGVEIYGFNSLYEDKIKYKGKSEYSCLENEKHWQRLLRRKDT